MRALLSALKPDILADRVVLGVETHQMRESFAKLTGLPVAYFPHPVQSALDSVLKADDRMPDKILMACYGPARQEKGSDVLQKALNLYLRQSPESTSRFSFQWVEDFKNERGEMVGLTPQLQSNSRVNVIRHYFGPGEYARHLFETQVMLLPYRRSSYRLRVSRVMIESLVNGIPVVTTKGTTLFSQAAEFGAVVGCEDDSAESLCAAIGTAGRNYPELRKRARERIPNARAHFSVKKFRELLLELVATKSGPVSQPPASPSFK
jgi:glycosyltransferase involved in cell wall biosynthesis